MPTKAQLQAELEALRHNYDLLETKVVRLEEARDALQRQLTVAIAQRNEQLDAKHDALNAAADARIKRALRPQAFPRPIFEFDPHTQGDFQRACALAEANNGVVQRIRSEHA